MDRVADERCLLVGHSLGGTLLPRIAVRDGRVAAGVLLAPLGRALHDALADQIQFLRSARSSDAELSAAELEDVEAWTEKIRTLDIADDETVLGPGRHY